MTEFNWVDEATVIYINAEQADLIGGGTGIRDFGLLQSALMRPQHVAHYEDGDIFACAAAYGFGLAKNHPFVDGNKRMAFLVTLVFLADNGYRVTAGDQACIEIFLGLAAGEVNETDLVAWLTENTTRIDS